MNIFFSRKVGILFFILFVFLLILPSNVFGVYCSVVNRDTVLCLQDVLNEQSCINFINLGGKVVDASKCTTNICCQVKDANGKIYYGTKIQTAQGAQDIHVDACERISEILPYQYLSYSNYSNSICERMNLANIDPGFYEFNGCLLNVSLPIVSSQGESLTDVIIEYFQILEDNEILYQETGRRVSGRLSFVSPLLKPCENIQGNLKLRLKAKKDGYEDFVYEGNIARLPGFTQISLIDSPQIYLYKPSYWQIRVNFTGIDSSTITSFFLKYTIQNSVYQVPVIVNTQSPTVNFRIPKPQGVQRATVLFEVKIPEYNLFQESKELEISSDEYSFLFSLTRKEPLVMVNVSVSDRQITSSGCDPSKIIATASAFNYARSSSMMYKNNNYVALIPLYSSKTFEELSNNEKKLRVEVSCEDSNGNIYVGFKEINIISSGLVNVVIDQVLSAAMYCGNNNIFYGLISYNSVCKAPCRRFYTYNCNENTCTIPSEDSNIIRNQIHIGLCDNGFMCDAFGECVPVQNECMHTGGANDCINVGVLDGFYYCDADNKIKFINLSMLYIQGEYEKFVNYCSLCSMDSECKTCNNPNPLFGNKLGVSCNVDRNAYCNKRMITKEDLERIEQQLEPQNLYTQLNLQEQSQFYEYCFYYGCGQIDNDCKKPCNELSSIYQSRTGTELRCLNIDSVVKFFSFGICDDNLVCGVSREDVCFGASVLNSNRDYMYEYLVFARGGTILERNGIKCSSVPIPEDLPQIGETTVPLNQISYSNLSPLVKSALNYNENYFNQNRGKVFGLCVGVAMNFSDTRYCCANGPQTRPCESAITVNMKVQVKFNDNTIKDAVGFVFKLTDQFGNEFVLAPTDEKGTLIFTVPRKNYTLTLINHPVYEYKAQLNLENATSPYNLQITITDNGRYREVFGFVLGDQTVLRYVDVELQRRGYSPFKVYTSAEGKYYFGYLLTESLEDVNITVNREYINPFYQPKILSDLNLASERVPYNITLEQNSRMNLSGFVYNEGREPLHNVSVVVLGIEGFKPANWGNAVFSVNTSQTGNFRLLNLPCNRQNPPTLRIRFEHPNFISQTISFVANCAETQLEVVLQEKNCLLQEVTPENIRASINNDGELEINWTFTCSNYALGFGIKIDFIGKKWLISNLIPTEKGKYAYSYKVNLNDIGLLDYAGYRGYLNTLSINNIIILTVWEKPFVNITSKSADGISFDYGCVKRHWFKIAPGQYLNYVLGYRDKSDKSNDLYVCVNGRYENATGFSQDAYYTYVQNKTNPYAFKLGNFTAGEIQSLTSYQYYNPDTILSQYCAGPLLGFGTSFAENTACKDLPLTKYRGLQYYYKSCVEVKNCYDYNTKTACLENPCLPYECEWKPLLNYTLFESKEELIGICIPKDPVFIDCSKYQRIIDNLSDLIPFLLNKIDYSFISIESGISKEIVTLFGQNNSKELGYHNCVFNISNSISVSDPTYVRPKQVNFLNRYYYRSTDQLESYVKTLDNYGIFDYDEILSKRIETYEFNYDLNKNYMFSRNSSVGLPLRKYSQGNLFDGYDMTIMVKGLHDLMSKELFEQAIVIDSEPPQVDVSISIPYKYVGPLKNYAFYVLELKIKIPNEDWVVANVMLVPQEIHLPGINLAGTTAQSFSVVQNISLDDGVKDSFEKILYSVKYHFSYSGSDYVPQSARDDFESNKQNLIMRYHQSFNFSQNEFLIPSGIYELKVELIDKVGNRGEYSFTVILPRHGNFFKTGYYKVYTGSESPQIFIESLAGDVDFTECRYDSMKRNNYVEYRGTYEASGGRFEKSISLSELKTLFSDSRYWINDSLPDGLFTIYSVCKDSLSNIYEIPTISFFYDNSKPECTLSFYTAVQSYQNVSIYEIDTSDVLPSGIINLVCRDKGERRNQGVREEVFDPLRSLTLPIISLDPLRYNVQFEALSTVNDTLFIDFHTFSAINLDGYYYLTLPMNIKYSGKLNYAVDDGSFRIIDSKNLKIDAREMELVRVEPKTNLYCRRSGSILLLDNFGSTNILAYIYNPSIYADSSIIERIAELSEDFEIEFFGDFKIDFITSVENATLQGNRISDGKWKIKFSSPSETLEQEIYADAINIEKRSSAINGKVVKMSNGRIEEETLSISGISFENYGAKISKINSSVYYIFLSPYFNGSLYKINPISNLEIPLNNAKKQVSEIEVFKDELKAGFNLYLRDKKGEKLYTPNFVFYDSFPSIVSILSNNSKNQRIYGSSTRSLLTSKYFCYDQNNELIIRSNFKNWPVVQNITITHNDKILFSEIFSYSDVTITNSNLRENLNNYIGKPLNLTITFLPGQDLTCNLDNLGRISYVIVPIDCEELIESAVDLELEVIDETIQPTRINDELRFYTKRTQIQNAKMILGNLDNPQSLIVRYSKNVEDLIRNVSFECVKEVNGVKINFPINISSYAIRGNILNITMSEKIGSGYDYCEILLKIGFTDRNIEPYERRIKVNFQWFDESDLENQIVFYPNSIIKINSTDYYLPFLLLKNDDYKGIWMLE
ncbi:MAG: carboxypeptidase-like regulatory domain-containing protein [Candidatus Woesearchaeota archaeon]